ncbi:MAG: hypothetical protein GY949_18395 [Gammaproteobacteria bacterium]|nr:hypothetical protein [Gammaproteobacteria bacterium]
MREQLGDLERKVIGVVRHDQDIMAMALSGNALGKCNAREDVMSVVNRLEQALGA